jgi:hypothetical protein
MGAVVFFSGLFSALLYLLIDSPQGMLIADKLLVARYWLLQVVACKASQVWVAS